MEVLPNLLQLYIIISIANRFELNVLEIIITQGQY
ncbi:hypothetical protein SAMN02746011_01685 [Globicatella sulfidifaciens DSM 15739]|uniref:Uncharacterized protein n=1 Tax=Globicatella sulfidifaciens DSM 15739 TaxID=1121925 RepID=A0A1T4NAE0_9LACT|nr:hypothetical protein SAMN02746011_01685 [Globicatella sulfidifaciens DSM 15739]